MAGLLFQPITVGQVRLRNRTVLAPMALGFTPGGVVNPRLEDFYEERARGGVGLLTAVLAALPYGKGGLERGSALACYHDRFIPGLRRLAEVAHRHGAAIAGQLAVYPAWALEEAQPSELAGPSDIPMSRRTDAPHPRPLARAEVERAVVGLGEAARRCREAGFDAVELHAAGGETLLSQFLSPFTNRRQDEYGGSLEGRARLLLEAIAAARQAAGWDYTYLARIPGDDFVEGGNSLEDTRRLAPLLEAAGLHALDVTTGWGISSTPFAQMSVPNGAFLYLAQAVKEAVSIPVIGGTRVTDPLQAEEAIARGQADLIYLGRALIADPEWPNKAQEGRRDDICPCIGCCRCLDETYLGRPLSCSVNPRAGREGEFRPQPAPVGRRVLVVGGGPAGMQAALVASQRGHRVTLMERAGGLGGTLSLASAAPFKGGVASFTRYLIAQVQRHPIEVRVGQEVSVQDLEAARPQAVILATGARPAPSGIPGASLALGALDVLAGEAGVGGRVVIVGGGMVGCEAAEFLAQGGKEVTLLEAAPWIGNDIGPHNRWVVARRLAEARVRIETGVEVAEITPAGVRGRRQGREELFPADTVVLATGLRSSDELARELQGKGIWPRCVGDCLQPRNIAQAMEEGFRAGLEV